MIGALNAQVYAVSTDDCYDDIDVCALCHLLVHRVEETTAGL